MRNQYIQVQRHEKDSSSFSETVGISEVMEQNNIDMPVPKAKEVNIQLKNMRNVIDVHVPKAKEVKVHLLNVIDVHVPKDKEDNVNLQNKISVKNEVKKRSDVNKLEFAVVITKLRLIIYIVKKFGLVFVLKFVFKFVSEYVVKEFVLKPIVRILVRTRLNCKNDYVNGDYKNHGFAYVEVSREEVKKEESDLALGISSCWSDLAEHTYDFGFDETVAKVNEGKGDMTDERKAK